MLDLFLLAAAAAIAAPAAVPPGEEPVDPYAAGDANAGAAPIAGEALWRAFHAQPGVDRIVETLIARSVADPRIGDIFKGQDLVRLRRTLKEQFCYILGGGCGYSGRTMKDAHKDLGLQVADFNALVENLQAAMRREGVPFMAQNRLLARLAPMKREMIER